MRSLIGKQMHAHFGQGAFCAQKCEDIRREFDKLQYYL